VPVSESVQRWEKRRGSVELDRPNSGAFVATGGATGKRAVVGACAEVAKDVLRLSIVADHPARPIGTRRNSVKARFLDTAAVNLA
jgi:serine acetyltransferase